MKKRIISILLAILMVFAMIPLTTGKVYAESDPDTEPPVINSQMTDTSAVSRFIWIIR